MAIKDYEFWLVVGTQFLYGEEIFETIDAHSNEIASFWSFGLLIGFLFEATLLIFML